MFRTRADPETLVARIPELSRESLQKLSFVQGPDRFAVRVALLIAGKKYPRLLNYVTALPEPDRKRFIKQLQRNITCSRLWRTPFMHECKRNTLNPRRTRLNLLQAGWKSFTETTSPCLPLLMLRGKARRPCIAPLRDPFDVLDPLIELTRFFLGSILAGIAPGFVDVELMATYKDSLSLHLLGGSPQLVVASVV